MPCATATAYCDYGQVFRVPTLQRGRPTALDLSPTKRWLCLATDNGDLMVLRSTYGRIYFHVDMGRQDYVTAITWATDYQIILGCANGAVYTATLATDPAPGENRVSITRLMHEEDSPIRALAWDSDQKRLALAYAHHVSIWWRIYDKRPRVWEEIDEFRASSTDLSVPGQIVSLWFSSTKRNLITGLETGTIVWSGKGNMMATDADINESRIGIASLSSDNSIMAISTRNQSIVIWPFLPEGPLTNLANTYLLESGQEWHKFESRTPVALTLDRTIVCGTLDGTIVILAYTGSCLQKLKNGTLDVLFQDSARIYMPNCVYRAS
ncbi:hypothetical protein FRC09_007111 [Ceratobasidium sp. 395]|nr:hypothetical protein FRC09_007111 [Ceratobasidium sp. 395]